MIVFVQEIGFTCKNVEFTDGVKCQLGSVRQDEVPASALFVGTGGFSYYEPSVGFSKIIQLQVVVVVVAAAVVVWIVASLMVLMVVLIVGSTATEEID